MGIVTIKFTKVHLKGALQGIEQEVSMKIDSSQAQSWLALEGIPYTEIFTKNSALRKNIRVEV